MPGPGDITILLPCRDQQHDLLVAALGSVLGQSAPDWRLLAILETDTPAAVRELILESRDPRIACRISEGRGLGGALNTGMRAAETELVCLLLSDDLLDREAIATLQRYRRRFPEADFLHSSRRCIDAEGRICSPVGRSLRRFAPSHFWTRGSPVKHLMCWRVAPALAAGGMDEALSAHGCDDYDFPWTMADAGARFQAVDECLYYYRIHHQFDRLSTDVPIDQQVEIVRRIHRKHGVPAAATESYQERALRGYLFDDAQSYLDAGLASDGVTRCREAGPELREPLTARGLLPSDFFPHRAYLLPKAGPDGFRAVHHLLGRRRAQGLWQLVLFASETYDLPDELFFDDDVMWHQQHLGLKGQVAVANLYQEGRSLYGLCYFSDLVQRISRRREHKTRVEKKLKGWPQLLYNAILSFALDRGIETFYSATAALAMTHTDRARPVEPEMFQRIYDRSLHQRLSATRQGGWWRVDVAANRDRVVRLPLRREPRRRGKIICVCHDIERGLGHPGDAERARVGAGALAEMLAAERAAGLRATYNVVGTLLPEVREPIAGGRHALAFHTYDHPLRSVRASALSWAISRASRLIPGMDPGHGGQLARCRGVDYRLKGYRPSQSWLTPDLTDEALHFHNFEWVASSARSLGSRQPRLDNGVARIPIAFDDFDLYRRRLSYRQWQAQALAEIERRDVVAFSLHDCYADSWLPHYRAFLDQVSGLGTVLTLDELAAEIFLRAAV